MSPIQAAELDRELRDLRARSGRGKVADLVGTYAHEPVPPRSPAVIFATWSHNVIAEHAVLEAQASKLLRDAGLAA